MRPGFAANRREYATADCGGVVPPLNEVPIQRIFRDDKAKRAKWRDHVIDPTGRFWSHADVADGRFAEGPDFKLEAVRSTPAGMTCIGRLRIAFSVRPRYVPAGIADALRSSQRVFRTRRWCHEGGI